MSDRFTLHHGDCIEVMRAMPDNSVDSIVTDPPYELTGKSGRGGFMGKEWDATGIAFNPEMWSEALRILKPGGHLLAFSGSRTYHRMAVAIEDAGFEIRDQIMWIYGSGFPKSLDVSKAIDKAAPRVGLFNEFAAHFSQQRKIKGLSQKQIAVNFPSKTGGLTGCVWNWENGASVPTLAQWKLLQPLLDLSEEFAPLIERIEAEREIVGKTEATFGYQKDGERWDKDHFITAPATPAAQQWAGWGTALKPAHEPIVVARKPLTGTVAANVLAHGVGALNIDGCRVGSEATSRTNIASSSFMTGDIGSEQPTQEEYTTGSTQGRWPANVIHDGSDEVVELFPDTKSGALNAGHKRGNGTGNSFVGGGGIVEGNYGGDSGSAARFFYCAKANKRDRNEGLDGFTAKQADESRKEGNPGGDNPRNRGVNKRLNHHPTVKPTDLMRYLIRLVTPQGATILDPFMGSGSTGKAAMYEGVNFIGIEQDAEYLAIAKARIEFALNKPLEDQLFERKEPTDAELLDQLALPLDKEETA